MPLTDAKIRQAKARDRAWKLTDGNGLYILVRPNGSRRWKFRFRVNGKEQTLSFGPYPLISLKEARFLRDEARLELYRGGDPARRRREEKVAARLREQNSFKDVAQEYLRKCEAEGRAPTTIAKATWFLELLGPDLGRQPVADIKAYDLLVALQKLERAGHRETARRVRSFASRIFRYAIATRRADADPTPLLRGAIAAPLTRHHAAITEPRALGGLLRAVESYEGALATQFALRIAPHVFLRPGELRNAEWHEIDLTDSVWRIPAARMKMGRPHAVPLSRQVAAMFAELAGLTGRRGLIFASDIARGRPISENTMNQAFRRMGFTADEVTAHGLRATASTLLNESGRWSIDAIERALAHKDVTIRGIYHRGDHWPERVAMAQWWSDYLDRLRKGGLVTPGSGRGQPSPSSLGREAVATRSKP